LLIVIRTAGMTAPVLSVTVPVREPRSICAVSRSAAAKKKTRVFSTISCSCYHYSRFVAGKPGNRVRVEFVSPGAPFGQATRPSSDHRTLNGDEIPAFGSPLTSAESATDRTRDPRPVTCANNRCGSQLFRPVPADGHFQGPGGALRPAVRHRNRRHPEVMR
jgi:hypothetical protein